MEYIVNNKEKNIDHLYKARASHTKWMNSVKLLVSGLTVEEKAPSPIIQDSLLGQWFYNEALQFAKFNSQQTLNDIESLIEKIYNTYTQIYAIYFGKQSGIIETIFGVNKSTNKHELELASKYYEESLLLSDQLKQKLVILERQFFALSLEQHNEVKIFEVDTSLSEQSLLNRTDKNNYRFGARSY